MSKAFCTSCGQPAAGTTPPPPPPPLLQGARGRPIVHLSPSADDDPAGAPGAAHRSLPPRRIASRDSPCLPDKPPPPPPSGDPTRPLLQSSRPRGGDGLIVADASDQSSIVSIVESQAHVDSVAFGEVPMSRGAEADSQEEASGACLGAQQSPQIPLEVDFEEDTDAVQLPRAPPPLPAEKPTLNAAAVEQVRRECLVTMMVGIGQVTPAPSSPLHRCAPMRARTHTRARASISTARTCTALTQARTQAHAFASTLARTCQRLAWLTLQHYARNASRRSHTPTCIGR